VSSTGEAPDASASPGLERQLVAWRRHLHAHPELSFSEFETARFVEQTLRGFAAFELSRPTATSVVAALRCGAGPTIALRADMDALPIEEQSGLAFASNVPGVMHACGHDAHTAILLGVAASLAERRDELAGELRLIFQHAEELPPGGAAELVSAGVLDGVEAIVGCHVLSTLETGRVAVPVGETLAAPDSFTLLVRGRGGHAAAPHQTADPVLAAAQTISALQQIVSRRLDPLERAVLSVTRINGGSANNVIPESVELGGTVRTFKPHVRALIRAAMLEVAQATAAAHGCSAELAYEQGYAATVNDAALAEQVRLCVPPERLVELAPLMAGEDFSAYQQLVPGCFFFVGAGGPEAWPHHHPRFAIDEACLPVAHALFVAVASSLLTR
jgi:amidohydrolase